MEGGRSSPLHQEESSVAVTLVVQPGYWKWQQEGKTPPVSRQNTQNSSSKSSGVSPPRTPSCRSSSTKATPVSSEQGGEWGRAPSVRSVGGWRPRPMASLRRANSDKAADKSRKRSIKVVRKMSVVVKADSVKSQSSQPDSFPGVKSCRSSKGGGVSRRSSFYRVLDVLRGAVGRRTSSSRQQQLAPPGGQTDFLASISKMSDSRIVEDWLLSLDNQAEPEPVEVPGGDEGLLKVEGSRDEGLTPTNELFEHYRKAEAEEVKSHRILFAVASSEDDESLPDDGRAARRPSSAPPTRPGNSGRPGYGRQVSECSEYTTDTHDTGETAKETARNTAINTQPSFTSEGDEIRKGGPGSGPGGVEAPLAFLTPICGGGQDDEEVAAINSERLEQEERTGTARSLDRAEQESHVTSRSSETVMTGSSMRRARREGSEGPGRGVEECCGTGCSYNPAGLQCGAPCVTV